MRGVRGYLVTVFGVTKWAAGRGRGGLGFFGIGNHVPLCMGGPKEKHGFPKEKLRLPKDKLCFAKEMLDCFRKNLDVVKTSLDFQWQSLD